MGRGGACLSRCAAALYKKQLYRGGQEGRKTSAWREEEDTGKVRWEKTSKNTVLAEFTPLPISGPSLTVRRSYDLQPFRLLSIYDKESKPAEQTIAGSM